MTRLNAATATDTATWIGKLRAAPRKPNIVVNATTELDAISPAMNRLVRAA